MSTRRREGTGGTQGNRCRREKVRFHARTHVTRSRAHARKRERERKSVFGAVQRLANMSHATVLRFVSPARRRSTTARTQRTTAARRLPFGCFFPPRIQHCWLHAHRRTHARARACVIARNVAAERAELRARTRRSLVRSDRSEVGRTNGARETARSAALGDLRRPSAALGSARVSAHETVTLRSRRPTRMRGFSAFRIPDLERRRCERADVGVTIERHAAKNE